MITYRNTISQDIDLAGREPDQLSQSRVAKVENKQLWFFLGVAPLAVMIGWSLVGLALTGDWAWEMPLGLLFSCMGSMVAMVGSSFKF